jgi:hypothetical protein
MKWLLLVLIALLIVYPWLARMRAPRRDGSGSRSDPSTMQRLIHRIMVPSRPPDFC